VEFYPFNVDEVGFSKGGVGAEEEGCGFVGVLDCPSVV